MGLVSASLLLAGAPSRMSMRTKAWADVALAVTMMSLVTASCARAARPQTRGTVTVVVSPRWLWKVRRQMMRIDREVTRLEGRNHSESAAAGVQRQPHSSASAEGGGSRTPEDLSSYFACRYVSFCQFVRIQGDESTQ
ncbi:unnamed protein product [Ectocarpus sp. 13 AM-2016]